jgi:hypothetical protein
VRRGINATSPNRSSFVVSAKTETGTVGRGKGQNEIYAKDISSPGVAQMNYHCYWFFGWHYGLGEVDVVLDSSRPWVSSSAKSSNLTCTGTRRPINSVITHEVGHFLGFMHVHNSYTIMGDSWRYHHTNGSTANIYFGEDGSRGLECCTAIRAAAFGVFIY